MLKFIIFSFILVITLCQEEPVKIDLLQRFVVTINQPNKLKYYYVDIGEQLTPEEEALVIQPDGGNRVIHYYTQKDRKPTPDDHDVSEYLFHQRFVLRRDTNVKRLYFGFYTRSNGTASNIAVVFKAKTTPPTLNSGMVPLSLEFKKGYIGTFRAYRSVPHDFGLLIETTDENPTELFLVKESLFIPNELWKYKALRLNRGVNALRLNESSVHFGIYAKQDLKINIIYSHHLSFIQDTYVGKKIGHLEHFSMKRKKNKQKIALFSKGKEMKLYLNHGDGNVPNPDEHSHQMIGKQIYGLSGYWGSIIEVEDLKENIKLGVDNGELNQNLFLIPDTESEFRFYYPTLIKLSRLSFTVRTTDFGPFNYKFDVSLQRKSNIKVTQIKNGVSSVIKNVDQDFKLDIELERGDHHVWVFEGDNIILIRAGPILE